MAKKSKLSKLSLTVKKQNKKSNTNTNNNNKLQRQSSIQQSIKTLGSTTSKQLNQNHNHNKKIPFEEDDKILLIGEGNFSFAASLAERLKSAENIVATCYDSKHIIHGKYLDASDFIQSLLELDGKIIYDVDAVQLTKIKSLKHMKFNKIVFNFPHVGKGITDVQKNIKMNQSLLSGFFSSSQSLLYSTQNGDECDGQIYVTLKTGDPYDQWNIKRIAKECQLQTLNVFPFDPDFYPGYTHRRTIGFKEGKSAAFNEELKSREKPCRTFVFAQLHAFNRNLQKKRKRSDDD